MLSQLMTSHLRGRKTRFPHSSAKLTLTWQVSRQSMEELTINGLTMGLANEAVAQAVSPIHTLVDQTVNHGAVQQLGIASNQPVFCTVGSDAGLASKFFPDGAVDRRTGD